MAPVLFHGTINGTAGLALMVVAGGGELTVGITGAAGIMTLIFANVILLARRRDRL